MPQSKYNGTKAINERKILKDLMRADELYKASSDPQVRKALLKLKYAIIVMDHKKGVLYEN